MFVSNGQFYVFLSCVAFGGFCGVLIAISHISKKFIINKIICFFIDLILFVIVSISYVVYSNLLNFPDYRLYMTVGVVLGFVIYMETFHILLAKILKWAYNRLRKRT